MDKITEKIKQIFKQFDKNKNGCIDKKELYSLSNALNNTLSPAELSDLFKNFDEDASGEISWEEFINFWIKN